MHIQLLVNSDIPPHSPKAGSPFVASCGYLLHCAKSGDGEYKNGTMGLALGTTLSYAKFEQAQVLAVAI